MRTYFLRLHAFIAFGFVLSPIYVYGQNCTNVDLGTGTVTGAVNCTGNFLGRIGQSSAPPYPAGFTSGVPTQDNVVVNTGAGNTIALDSAVFGTNTATILLKDGANITVGAGGTVSAPSSGAGVNNQAIFIGSSGSINIGTNATVINYATGGTGVPTINAGNNTIEMGSNNTLLINTGALVYAAGVSGSSEAINPTGSGNTITNYGTIKSKTGSALWFQNTTPIGSPNIVNNYGSIISEQANQTVFGGNGSVNFTNYSGGNVVGNVAFTNGVNTVTLYTGSTITGSINGGSSGQNTFNLQGTGVDTLDKAIVNFKTLNKNDSGFWTLNTALPTTIALNVNQGTLQLSGDNTAYSGTAAINTGATLQGTTAAVVGSTGNGSLTNNGTISFVDSGSGAYAAPIVGTGSVAMNGSGSVTLSGINTYSGGTAINSGTLAVTNNSSIGSGLLAINNGATFQAVAPVAFNNSVALTGQGIIDTNTSSIDLSGAISGAGAINKIGAGTLTLSGANTYSGGTSLNVGTIAVGSNTALGSGGLAMANGTTLQAATSVALTNAVTTSGSNTIDTNGNNLSLSGVISGAGAINKIGAGTLTLSGANNYSGGTTVTAGTLAGNTTSIQGNIVNNATVNFNQNVNGTYAGVMSGSGALVKDGLGTIVVSNANTYSGDTNINAGNFILTGSIASNTNIAAGAMLQGGGVINGNVYNYGSIAPSFDGNQTNLTVNGSYFGSGGTFVSNVYAPPTNPIADKLVVSGNVSGSTGVSIVDKGGLGNRTSGNGVEVISVGGASTANAFALNHRVASGAFEYKLVKGDAVGAGNSWYLRTDNPADPASPASPPTAVITPEVGERIEVAVYPALPSLVQLYAQTAVDTLDQRRGDLNLVEPDVGSKKKSNDWARIIGKTGTSTPSSVNYGPKMNFNAYALQFGVDVYQNEEQGGSRTYVGPYVTIGSANANTSSQTGGVSTGSINGMQAYSLGLYATHFANNGLYVDALAQGTRYLKAGASSVQGSQLQTQGSGFTGSIEGGGRWNVGKLFISPQAQIVYDAIGMSNATDAYGEVNFNKSELTRGRLGLLAGHKDVIGNTPIFAYLRASYWNIFNAGTSTTMASLYGANPITFQSQTGSRWMTVDAEVNARITKDTNLFLNLAVENSLMGTYQAYSGRVGMQTRF